MTIWKHITKLNPIRYLGHRFVSKWVVLLIDLMIISLSLIISYTLLSRQVLSSVSVIDYYKGLISVLAFSLVGHYAFKPHQGVIRHTSMHDVKRVFYSRTLSFVLNTVFIYYLSDALQLSSYAVPMDVAFINYIFSLYLLVQFRLGVKYIFNMGKKNRSKSRIVIYGAGVSGQIVHEALSSSFDVVAFIDDNPLKKGKLFKGIPILFSKDNITPTLERLQVTQAIISLQNLPPKDKRKIVDRCIELGLEAKLVPPIEKWLDGELTTSQIKMVNIEELLGRDVISLDKSSLMYSHTGKTILVTGAAGSIGSEIARQIVYYKPKCILLLDQAETPLYHLEMELDAEIKRNEINIQIILGDINDLNTMRSIFKSYPVDWVFHAAAYKHVPAMEMNPLQAVTVNILGTRLIADLADEYGVEKMVFVSTDKAVNPTNVMGASKRAAEMYIQSKNRVSKTSYITTRFGNVLGSNGSVIPLFKKQIAEGGPITVTHPEITRFFMTIPEACQLVLEAGVMGKGGEIFVFDMGESVKIIDLAHKMIRLSGLVPDKDIKIKFTGLRPGEKLFEELLNNAETIIPTHHEKIMIAKISQKDYQFVSRYIDKMQDLLQHQAGENAVVAALKELVPEYISRNSTFESLDFKDNPNTKVSEFFQ
ncbi:MAG: polysaccharide biosynthesis protein [Chitinophagaceae bacterium]|nr:polysaccharide biosynthesis protein [Chitinophagaceae bacterium]